MQIEIIPKVLYYEKGHERTGVVDLLNVEIEKAGYPGAGEVIHDVHFSVEKGEQIGLIGPNGAGKSTTIKSVLGLLAEVHGRIEWENKDARYAYVPERPVFYSELTLWEHLSLAAAAFSLDKRSFEKRAAELLKTFSMDQKKHHLLDSFSKGMQQKAMLIIALTLRPSLYIVDEPFTGLDPRATNLLLRLLEEERKRGAAVLMTTHVLDTAEKICDRFMLMLEGKMLANGSLADVREQADLPQGSLFDCFDRLTEDVSRDT